jgi:hypothetical protein
MRQTVFSVLWFPFDKAPRSKDGLKNEQASDNSQERSGFGGIAPSGTNILPQNKSCGWNPKKNEWETLAGSSNEGWESWVGFVGLAYQGKDIVFRFTIRGGHSQKKGPWEEVG